MNFSASAEGSYFDIDWGDGTISKRVISGNHIYENEGIYNIKLYGAKILRFSFSDVNVFYNIGVISIEFPNTITYDHVLFNGTAGGRAQAAPLLEYIVLPPSQKELRLNVSSAMKCKYLAIPNNINNITYMRGLQLVECLNIPPLVTSFNNPYDWSNLRKIVFDGTCKSFNLGSNTAREVDITIKDGVETIMDKMQYFHSKKIETPNSLLSIPNNWLFNGIVDEVIINGTPTFNGTNTFREGSITTLRFISMIPPTLSSQSVFYGNGIKDKKVYIPLGAREAYENDTNWAAAIAAGYITLVEE